jgi:TRAP-type C4-dicarboxylate transport system substrate-binding protein
MQPSRAVLTSAVLSVLLAGGAASAQERIPLKVIGQPIASGLIQQNKEQPFFETLVEKTGLPLEVDYKPIDTLGIKDTDQLRVMRSGLFDAVSLRMPQISRDEPMTLGFDLVGLNPTFAAARTATDAWSPVLDARLQERFQIKLLGVWPAGPQVLFCKPPISGLADVKGLKVRIGDQNIAKFIESLGGTPVPLPFPEVHQSLSLGVVDCAITGPASANSAGWPEVTTHMLPLSFQFAINGYGVGLKAWNQLSADDQAKLAAAVGGLVDDIWAYSEELATDALNCNAGKQPCANGRPYELTEVAVTDADLAVVKRAVADISLPAWAEQCDKQNPSCSEDWRKTVGAAVGIE